MGVGGWEGGGGGWRGRGGGGRERGGESEVLKMGVWKGCKKGFG
jgi:hypothetical protein